MLFYYNVIKQFNNTYGKLGNWPLGHVFYVYVLYKCHHSTKLYWENPQARCHLYAAVTMPMATDE